ncbi:hypothetical protein CCP3SC15_1420005 [Gammaproteobacteria bacterium]
MGKETKPVESSFLFCNRRGECYVNEDGYANGWDSIWQRFMDRLLSETNLKVKFTEHDLRAKCASDAESLEHARSLHHMLTVEQPIEFIGESRRR